MRRFVVQDFKVVEQHPRSPQALRSAIEHLIVSSMRTRAKVESSNSETGEYRIVLQGTLDQRETPTEGWS